MRFTPSQLQAIEHIDGHLQLIACAGSGKTEVVSRRIVNLLKPRSASGGGCKPTNIVAFTFTEKAAAELKERIHERCKAEFGELTGLAEMYIGTVHGFCLQLLRDEVPEYLKYVLLNDVQQFLFVSRHSSRSGLTRATTILGQPLTRYRDARHYLAAMSILREDTIANESALANCSTANHLPDYEYLLNEHTYFDYSSILNIAVAVLHDDASLRQRLQNRIQHLIVDEYQDVNPIQENLIKTLGKNVCVVGDDDQTLYQWRGSDVSNILGFSRRYDGVRQIKLEENFRSSDGIIEVARKAITSVSKRLDKGMIATAAQAFDPGDIVALYFETPEAEGAYIARTCKRLLGLAIKEGSTSRGMSWSDIAILLRSVQRDAAPILDALSAANIPFVVTGMNNLFSNSEANAARQLFYFLAGQGTVDDLLVAWKDARLGIAPATLARAVACAADTRDQLSGAAGSHSIDNLQPQLIAFLDSIELREDRIPNNRGEIVFYNLGKFSQIISDFETVHFHSRPIDKYRAFADFLFHQADSAYPEGQQGNDYLVPDTVQIMTVHQAKGLQWPAVFVPQLVRNRFPSTSRGGRTVWHLLPADAFSNAERYRGGPDDERRLFYVALTRSQKYLHLSWAPTSGNRRAKRPSVFFEEILESKFVKRWDQDYASRHRLSPRPRHALSNVRLSFSVVKHFFECPYQFKLRVLFGFNPPLERALGYGESVHNALSEVHKRSINGEDVSADEAARLVEVHFRVPYAFAELRKTLARSAESSIRDYIINNRENLRNLEFAEKRVEISLGNGVTLAGRIDLVRRLDSGEVAIVDLKSSDRAQAEQVTEAQLHVYALGYRQLTGQDADYVEIYDLENQKRRRRPVDEKFIVDVRHSVDKAAMALRQNTLKPEPKSITCGACDFRHLCPAAIHP